MAGRWRSQVGHKAPYRFQHLLGRARWDAEAMTAEVRNYALEHLGKEGMILAVDETGFMKQGEHSVGVQVQHCSLTGRLENCRSWGVPRLHQPAWTQFD